MGRPPARKASTKSTTAAVVKTVATSGPSTKTTKFSSTKKETADVLAKVETVTKVTVTKRKAATAVVAYADEDTENESPVEDEEKKKKEKETDKKPAPKKRKIKGAAKEEDNMPLAERTVIASLKRSMYIGAHVSGAGGKTSSFSSYSSQGFDFLILFISF